MRPSSTPSTKILPLLGFSSRIRRRTRVDLPAPEGPTRKRKSPSGTSRLTSRSASVPVGYVLWTCWKLITGRVAKSGVKTISCVSCCGVVRPRARGARSRAVYPKGPQGPSLSLRAKHWPNGGRLRRLRGISDSRDYRPFGRGDSRLSGIGAGLRRSCRPRLAQAPPQPRLDEGIDLAVEHGLGAAHLEPRAHVLDQRVRLQDVVADLGAELGRQHLAADLLEVLGRLLLLALEQPRLEHLHSHLPILHLRALVLASDDDPGRQVRDPDRRVRLVHVLSAGACGAIGVDADVLRVDHHRVLIGAL